MLAEYSHVPQRALYWEPPTLLAESEVNDGLRREVTAKGGDFRFYSAPAHCVNGDGPAALFELAIDGFGKACFGVLHLTWNTETDEFESDVELAWIGATDFDVAFDAGYWALVEADILD